MLPGVCKICQLDPQLCYPIYDPWWKFKCPQCSLQVLVQPGEEIVGMTLYDDRSRRVGRLARLSEPVVVKGVSYTHGLTMKAREGASYVLKAEATKGTQLKNDFSPTYIVRKLAEQ